MPDINGIPYVDSSDLVSAYPAVSLALATELDDQLGSKLNIAGGKILQIVRATDGTQRSTTSGTFVDASISVTITPQKNDSAILLIWACSADNSASDRQMELRITDASNNLVSGGGDSTVFAAASRVQVSQTLIGYSTPATTSATTYKGRFRSVTANSVSIRNDTQTGQIYAIEVSA